MINTTVQILVSILFALLFITVIYLLFLSSRILTYLAENYPKYYDLLGRPMFFKGGTDGYRIPTINSLRGQKYFAALILRGARKDTPNDQKLHEMIKKLRKLWLVVLLPIWLCLVAMTIYAGYVQT